MDQRHSEYPPPSYPKGNNDGGLPIDLPKSGCATPNQLPDCVNQQYLNNSSNPPPQPYYNHPGFQPQQQQQQQQQSTVTMVNAGQPQIVYTPTRPYQSFCGHIALACFVFWFCGIVFGLVAYILAMNASDSARTGQDVEARQFGRGSIGVSIAGIVVFGVFVGVFCGSLLPSGSLSSSSSSSSLSASYYGSNADRVPVRSGLEEPIPNRPPVRGRTG